MKTLKGQAGIIPLVEVILVVAVLAVIGIAGYTVVHKKPASTPPVATTETKQTTLVVGTVGDDTASEVKEFQPLADYLAAHLKDQGITAGRVQVAASPSEMAKLVREKKVDIYIDSAFPAYVVSQLAEAEPLVNRWKKGVEKYHSIIFVSKSSGITKLDGLKGKIIAFEDRFSTSGYFLPKAELLKSGYKLTQKVGPSDAVAPDEIGYYFTNDDGKVVGAIGQGNVIAGGQSNDDFQSSAGANANEYRILYQTADVFRHVVTVRTGLPASLKAEVRQTLLDMDQHPDGRATLKAFGNTTKFSPFEPSVDAAFAQIKELSGYVEDEIVNQ